MRPLFKQADDFSDFVKRFLNELKSLDSKYSLRWLSGRLGYKNPSILSDVVNRKVMASQDFYERLLLYLQLNGLEKQAFNNLFLQDKVKSQELKGKLQGENKLIFEYWDYGDFVIKPVTTKDLLVRTYFESDTSIQGAVECFSPYFNKNEVLAIIEKLLQVGELVQSENGEVAAGKSSKVNNTQKDTADIVDFISDRLKENKFDGDIHSLNLWVDEDQIKEINQAMIDTLEKIIVKAIDSKKEVSPDFPTKSKRRSLISILTAIPVIGHQKVE